MWRPVLFGLLIWLTLAQPIVADTARAVAYLPVYSQPAEELLNVLRPFVGGGTLVAHRDQLIVRGTTSEIAAVSEALERLDQPPRRLMIEVRLAEQSAEYDGAARRGSARVIGTRRQQDLLQRVQTLDGRPARIQTGEWRPVTNLVGVWARQGAAVFSHEMQSIDTGFYALARTHGDEVTVELYQQNEQAQGNGRLRGSSAQTTLRGPLDEWLDIGGEQRLREPGVRRWSTGDADERYLQLRVRLLD
ncbi:secretin N-terminal domain-containing protein [Halochromatium sp.]